VDTKRFANAVRKARTVKSKGSVWRGPEKDGVTYSLLSRFLCCRERFRLLVVEGLRPVETFNHRIEYGQMWHVCEEVFAKFASHPSFDPNAYVRNPLPPSETDWEPRLFLALRNYTRGLCQKHPAQQEQIQHWYNVCRVQFPVYVDYWAKHPDEKERTPLLQEQVFDIPYVLPSGRTVRLRGKWDSVDLIGQGKAAGVYLKENKTKGDIKEEQLKRQLSSGFDLQTMLYLVAMDYRPAIDWREKAIRGARYNVVRRPLSGGRHSITQHKPSKSNPTGEGSEEFYARLGGLIASEPEYFFMRWRIEIAASDVGRFRRECLDPILEQLCDWWEWISGRIRGNYYPEGIWAPLADTGRQPHYRYPFGVYNVLAEGGSGELDEYLATGSELGLQRVDNLFKELD